MQTVPCGACRPAETFLAPPSWPPPSYVVGSLLYFERALVVSKSLTGAGDRTTFFAWLNSWWARGGRREVDFNA
jgi:hypothetical protein